MFSGIFFLVLFFDKIHSLAEWKFFCLFDFFSCVCLFVCFQYFFSFFIYKECWWWWWFDIQICFYFATRNSVIQFSLFYRIFTNRSLFVCVCLLDGMNFLIFFSSSTFYSHSFPFILNQIQNKHLNFSLQKFKCCLLYFFSHFKHFHFNPAWQQTNAHTHTQELGNRLDKCFHFIYRSFLHHLLLLLVVVVVVVIYRFEKTRFVCLFTNTHTHIFFRTFG